MGLCRYVGNIHTKVTEGLLAEVFSSAGPLEGCKLIRKEKVINRISTLLQRPLMLSTWLVVVHLTYFLFLAGSGCDFLYS